MTDFDFGKLFELYGVAANFGWTGGDHGSDWFWFIICKCFMAFEIDLNVVAPVPVIWG